MSRTREGGATPLAPRDGFGLDAIPAELWKRLRSGRPRLLLLDYDGTLAPFHVERMRARMPGPTERALRRIAGELRDIVAIVSGRPLDELIALTGELPVHLVGSHGWQQRTAEGHRLDESPPPLVAERLALAHAGAAEAGWGDLLEAKPAAVMLHTRALPLAEAMAVTRDCTALWQRLFVREGIELLVVDGGLELRAAGRDKGQVVRALRRRHAEARVVAYLGDDSADETAFEALRLDGVTVRVGADERPTRALWRLESPQAVARFLEHWANALD